MKIKPLGYFLIMLTLFGIVGFSRAQEGALNNILVKELNIQYDDAAKTIKGYALIGNFAEESFNSLGYNLSLLTHGEGSGLGTIVNEEKTSSEFSISAKSELKKVIEYKLPEGLPPGEYNFVFQVTDSKGRPLGFDFRPINVTQDRDFYLTTLPEAAKIEISQQQYAWSFGGPAKEGEKVIMRFDVTNNNSQSVDNVIPYITTYPYTTTLEKVEERTLGPLSFQPGEKKTLAYEMTNFDKPQSYTAVIELKKDGKPIALPVRGHWVVEGMQGKIFNVSLDKNNNLWAEIIGSPYSADKPGQVVVQLADGKGAVIFSQTKELSNVGPSTQSVGFPLDLKQSYDNLFIKVDLEIADQLVDSYERKMEQRLLSQLNSQIQQTATTAGKAEKEKNKTAIVLALIFMLILLSGILIAVLIIRKRSKATQDSGNNNNDDINSSSVNSANILTILLAIVISTLFLGFSFSSIGTLFQSKAVQVTSKVTNWVADTGSYDDWGFSNRLEKDFSNTKAKNILLAHKACLEENKNDCNVSYYDADNSGIDRDDGHTFYFLVINWSSPYNNQSFQPEENVKVSLSNIENWCSDNDHYGTTIVWKVYDRETKEQVKSGSTHLDSESSFHSWNIGSFPSGRYAIFIEAFSSYGGLLYHGMIRYFQVVQADEFQCTGISGGTECANAQIGLTSDVSWHLSTDKCEFDNKCAYYYPAPTAALVAYPTSVSSGGSSTLTWTSTNAEYCLASKDWNGTRDKSGTELEENITINKEYHIQCFNLIGEPSEIAKATVTVQPPPYQLPGICGTNSKNFECGEEFTGSCCLFGSPVPDGSCVDPNPGKTKTWRCVSNEGIYSEMCSASREECNGDEDETDYWTETRTNLFP